MRPWYRGLGHLLRALRRDRGWSLRRAVHEARRLGVHVDRSLLRRTEAGLAVPGRVVLRRLALLYAVPAGELEEEAYLAEALRRPAPLPPGTDLLAFLERALARGRHLDVLAWTEEIRRKTDGRLPPFGEEGGRAWLFRAAAARALGLPGVARRALAEVAWGPWHYGAHVEACWRLAEEALEAGNPREALAHLDHGEHEAWESTDPSVYPRHLAREGRARIAAGRRVTGLRRLDEARDLARRSGNRAVLAEVLAQRALAVSGKEPEVATALAREAVAEARKSGDRAALVRRLLDLAAVLPGTRPGAPEARLEALREALGIARDARLAVEEFLVLDLVTRDHPEDLETPDHVLRRRRDALLSRLPWHPPRALRRREEILAAARQRAEDEEAAARQRAAHPREVPCAS